MMANAFSVLDEMCNVDPIGEYLVMFTSPYNFLEAKTGKDGWGFVKMAVNNETIQKLFFKQQLKLVLLVYDIDKFAEIKNGMADKKGGS